VWEARENVTAYDAWYVALAKSLGAKLATSDLCWAAAAARLASARLASARLASAR
jgi:predicted nucleic acid-binding protein